MLMDMIIVDSQESECFTVGTDNIGSYWEGVGGKWHHSNDRQMKLELAEVLAAVDITVNRYSAYLKLFRKAGAERIGFCSGGERWGVWVKVLTYRAGLGVSGCSGTINWFQRNPPESIGARNAGTDFKEVESLGEGWYSIIDCT